MGLIDRQAAIDAIEKLYLPLTKGETEAEEINRVAWRCALNCAEEMIGHLPSAQPEIVRCRDCKYFSYTTLGMPFACWRGAEAVWGETGEHASHHVCTRVDSEDHYCGYAERREDG